MAVLGAEGVTDRLKVLEHRPYIGGHLSECDLGVFHPKVLRANATPALSGPLLPYGHGERWFGDPTGGILVVAHFEYRLALRRTIRHVRQVRSVFRPHAFVRFPANGNHGCQE